MLREYNMEIARRKHLRFLEFTWQYASIPFLAGFHIEDVCKRIDAVIGKYRAGESSFLAIQMPFRHHKSQTVTRGLPPHWLGEFPEDEIIVASYSADLSHSFSRDSRAILQSSEYSQLYPKTNLSKTVSSVHSWGTETTNGDGSVSTGKTAWLGLGGSVTGKGGSLIIIDDFLKGRYDAESKVSRDRIWNSFTDDIMTRRAPKCLVIVLATPWHTDDLFGRIRNKMDGDSSFPQFEFVRYPAKSSKYENGYLFPEKFSKEWYESMYATLGSYSASGLLDCDPKARDGNMVQAKEGENWHFVDKKPREFKRLNRAWDLASTEKQVTGNDPDWTVGVKGGVAVSFNTITDETGKRSRVPIYSIYIEDIKRCREEAPKRDAFIRRVAVSDGVSVTQGIESVAGYKDTYTNIKSILKGICTVKKLGADSDKVVKVTQHLSMPFSVGNVYFNRAIGKDVLKEFLDELESFPSVVHDDMTDATALMVIMGKANTYTYKDVNR